MNLKSFVCASVLASGLLLSNSAFARNGSETHPQPICFARGAISKIVTVYLSPRADDAYFSVAVGAGQRMSIKVTPVNSHQGIVPALEVTSPSGHAAGADAPKARRFDTLKTQAGTYLIRVAPNLMASNGQTGTFRLKVWVR